MLGDLVVTVSVTRERPLVSTEKTRLGDPIPAGSSSQVLKGRLYEKSGKPRYGQQGRTDESTHSFIFNLKQVFYNTPGNPFTNVLRYDADVVIADRIVFRGNSYRVDNVIDISDEHDHLEARLTLCLPGGE